MNRIHTGSTGHARRLRAKVVTRAWVYPLVGAYVLFGAGAPGFWTTLFAWVASAELFSAWLRPLIEPFCAVPPQHERPRPRPSLPCGLGPYLARQDRANRRIYAASAARSVPPLP